MSFNTGISSAIAQYVYTQSNGNVVEPVNGSYLQAYCEYLGISEPIHNSWLISLCDHFGITEPINGSWTIALSNYYGIINPTEGTWWMTLAFEASPTPPTPSFRWNLNTQKYNNDLRIWNSEVPMFEFWEDVITLWENKTLEWQLA
jgi:hypothetical protein